MTGLRPLYIDCSAAGIRLEGPALVVARPAAAETRVPLRRLSHVIVRGAVPFATDALLSCLSAAVPVTFIALDGQVIGHGIAGSAGVQKPAACSIASLLARLVMEPSWPDVMSTWLRHAEQTAMLRSCQRLRVHLGLDLRPATVRVALARALPGGPTPGLDSLLRRLEGLLAAHLAVLFQRAEIPVAFRGHDGSPLDLRSYFVAVLRWHLWPTAAALLAHQHCHHHVHSRHAATSDARRRRLVVAYEATVPLIEAAFRWLLTSLDLRLREATS
jgi:hypothetical protein